MTMFSFETRLLSESSRTSVQGYIAHAHSNLEPISVLESTSTESSCAVAVDQTTSHAFYLLPS